MNVFITSYALRLLLSMTKSCCESHARALLQGWLASVEAESLPMPHDPTPNTHSEYPCSLDIHIGSVSEIDDVKVE